MAFALDSSVTLPNAYKTTRDKKTNVLYRVIKLDRVFIDRPTLDAVLGVEPEWTAKHLYDEAGEPTKQFSLTILEKRVLTLTGKFMGVEDGEEKLSVTKADVTDIDADLQPLGAYLTFKLTWRAGAEGAALDDLILQAAHLIANLDDGGQQDLFAKKAAGEKAAEQATNDILANLGKRPPPQPGAGV